MDCDNPLAFRGREFRTDYAYFEKKPSSPRDTEHIKTQLNKRSFLDIVFVVFSILT